MIFLDGLVEFLNYDAAWLRIAKFAGKVRAFNSAQDLIILNINYLFPITWTSRFLPERICCELQLSLQNAARISVYLELFDKFWCKDI